MPDPLLPGPANVTVQDGPAPSSAGMSYSESAAAWDDAAKAFGSAENLVQAHQDLADQAHVARINSAIETTQQGLQQANRFDASGLQQSLAQAPLQLRAERRWALCGAGRSAVGPEGR